MKQNTNRWGIFLIITGLTIGILIGLTGCGKEDPIRIGFIAGLSGRTADLGVGGRNGLMLAIEQQNQNGGINGRSIELIVRDDQQNPDKVKKGVKELLSQQIKLIIGPMTSSMAALAVELVNQTDAIIVSPTATTTDLLKIDDHFLRVISTTRDYARKSADFHVKKSKKKAVAIYDTSNLAYTKSWLENFQTAYESSGGQVLMVDAFTSGKDIVFYDRVKKLLESKPDLFLVITNAVDGALICQQTRKIDKTVTIAMSEWASTERFIELSGSASEGVYVAQFLDRNNETKRYLNFVKEYIERFGQEPGFAGIAGYDAGLVAFQGLLRQKKGESLKDSLIRQQTYNCVQQTITIDKFGDANRQTFVTMIKNGVYKTIK